MGQIERQITLAICIPQSRLRADHDARTTQLCRQFGMLLRELLPVDWSVTAENWGTSPLRDDVSCIGQVVSPQGHFKGWMIQGELTSTPIRQYRGADAPRYLRVSIWKGIWEVIPPEAFIDLAIEACISLNAVYASLDGSSLGWLGNGFHQWEAVPTGPETVMPGICWGQYATPGMIHEEGDFAAVIRNAPVAQARVIEKEGVLAGWMQLDMDICKRPLKPRRVFRAYFMHSLPRLSVEKIAADERHFVKPELFPLTREETRLWQAIKSRRA